MTKSNVKLHKKRCRKLYNMEKKARNSPFCIDKKNRWIYNQIYGIENIFDKNGYVVSEQVEPKFKLFYHRYSIICIVVILLGVITDIIGAYAKARQFWNEIQGDDFCRTIEQLIDNELLQMGEKMDKRDKSRVVIEALLEALREYRIIPQKMTPESCRCQEMCYEDENILYIRSKQLLQVAYEYSQRYHLQFQIVNEDEIIGLLERAQVLDIKELDGKRERSRKLPEPKGNTLRYLYLKKDKLLSYDFN